MIHHDGYGVIDMKAVFSYYWLLVGSGAAQSLYKIDQTVIYPSFTKYPNTKISRANVTMLHSLMTHYMLSTS